MRRLTIYAALIVALVVAVAVVWWWVRSQSTPQPVNQVRDERRGILPPGTPSDFFTRRAIGEPPRVDERPLISNVQIADLDRDGFVDVLVCDVVRNQVMWIRQYPRDSYTEHPLGMAIRAPAHAEAVDIDGDGDLDVLVAGLGVLAPSNNHVGAVIVLENDGRQHFTNHILSENIARVADARAGDLDGDGDLDVAVAGFGYDDGETSWLENRGGWTFERHVLQRLSGPINAIVTDINHDNRLDVVALVSQEWEEIWAFVGVQPSGFAQRVIWGSANADFGSSWISIVDLDRDGDRDILYSNGDAFDYAPANSRPWHGVQWLENTGGTRFVFHRIADLPGASSPQAADIDGDGDVDVVVSSAYNNWTDPAVTSLAWLENNGRMQFIMHRITSVPTHLITLAIGDLDGNGTVDLVTGGMHASRPYDRMSRITLWTNHGPRPR
jgi:hypothetical protein